MIQTGEAKIITEWIRSSKENRQSVMDYIFGKSETNPLENLRKNLKSKKSKNKE